MAKEKEKPATTEQATTEQATTEQANELVENVLAAIRAIETAEDAVALQIAVNSDANYYNVLMGGVPYPL